METPRFPVAMHSHCAAFVCDSVSGTQRGNPIYKTYFRGGKAALVVDKQKSMSGGAKMCYPPGGGRWRKGGGADCFVLYVCVCLVSL